MPTATLNGIDLYYEVSGSGPRLLFLNGSGATLATTGALVAPLTAAFEVAAFDQRGLGRSALPADPYSVADLASDALALVDHLGWKQFHLVGLSFGGMVAQELAVTNPERVDRLALLCTSSGGAGGSSYALGTLADMDPTERAAVSATVLDTRFTTGWLDEHEGDRALAGVLAQSHAVEKSEGVRRGEALQYRARGAHDVYERLPLVTCPTLVASGRYDGVAPPANGAAIAAQIPGARLRLFDGGHMFIVQDPTAFPEIIGFLQGG